MRKLILLCTSLCAMVLLFSVQPVMAQSVLWVGPNGNDGNACSQTSPCATFQGAINKGSVSQINCLGSGNYGNGGQLTIVASITIDCGTGNVGTISITGNGNAAILIQANSSSPTTIILRHLSLNGNGDGSFQNPASYGIVGNIRVGTLIVEDCTIQGVIGNGIYFLPVAGRGLLQVSNSQISGNGNGIVVGPAPNQIASVTLNRVELTGNSGNGLSLTGSGVIAGTIRHSVVGGNGNAGVYSETQVFFTVEESSIVANLNSGIWTALNGSVINVGSSTIGGNGTGVKAPQGSIISFGNNQFSANGTNGAFTSTTALQ